MSDDPARDVPAGPGALEGRGGPPLFPDAEGQVDSEPISILRAALVRARAEREAAVLKAAEAERLFERLKAAEAAKAAEAVKAAGAADAAEVEMNEASMRVADARRAYGIAQAAEARATLAPDVVDLAEARATLAPDVVNSAAIGEFDPYNLARSLVAGSPGRLGASGRRLSGGRLNRNDQAPLELAFWLAAGGLAEPPPPGLLTLSPYLGSLVLAARADPPARTLAAVELARGGSARRIPEALERHLDSLPGLARAEAEAVPGKILAFDGPIPEAPASEVFQTLLWVTESFSGWRREAMGLLHLKRLSSAESAKRLKLEAVTFSAELRHGYRRLAGALKAYLTRLAVARGHGLTDFPGLDGLRGGRPALSPVPSRGELSDRRAPPALEPPQGAASAVELESAELARRLTILSPDGLGSNFQPAFELAFWLAAAGLAEPPAAKPWPGLQESSRIVAPSASEALGFLVRAFEGLSDRRRLFFRLLYREGLDLLEVGRRLGMTRPGVRAERWAALQSLADKLRDYLLYPARPPATPGLDPLGGD